ncbi:Extra-large g-protein-like [Thalictrum thalictroides]|uniref:Extra-large g-protein-like n=1 Tax=Thalictrum thalictroides TaxID=46969 RepID=A0A7J6VDI2_THATH|nr:Extra-large g-protein-like [Thalictrum thalictroides]
MEEGTKVRLVRCPKCENVLSELPNVAVYQCGGCGTILQAKQQPISSGGSSEKSDDERVRVSSGKLESFPEKGETVDLSGASDRENNGIKHRQITRERGLLDGTAHSNNSSPSTNLNKVVNQNLSVSEYDERSLEQEAARVGKYRRPSKDPEDAWVLGNDHNINRSRDKSVRVNMEKEVGEYNPQMGISSGSRQLGQSPNWRSGERDGSIAYRRTPRAVAEDVRFSTTPYSGEGTSSYQPGPYGMVDPLKNLNSSGGSDRVQHLEKDRVELLRKLDELKVQLARSCEVTPIPNERALLDGRTIPLDPYVGHDTRFPEALSRTIPLDPFVGREKRFPDASSRQHRPLMQPFPTDKHAQRPMYSNHGLEPIPQTNRHAMDMQNFYPPMMHPSNEIPGYGDPFAPQTSPNQPLHQYQQHPSHDYFPAQYIDMDSDHNASYPTNTFFHQPACSCLHCYNKHWHTSSAQVPPGALHNRRYLDAPSNPILYHPENRGSFGGRGYNPRDTNLPLARHEPLPHFRRQRDLDTETSGLAPTRPRRVVPGLRNGRRCGPIAGGAPFISCHNCFELLSLPRKLLLLDKNYRKLRCGACSTIISVLFENKKITVCIPAQTKGGDTPKLNVRPAEVVKENLLQPHSQANHQGGAYSSDYDSSGYNFILTDTELGSSSMDRRLNLSESEKLQSLVYSCSTTSEDEESPDSVIARRDVSKSAELLVKAKGTSPLPGSPLREYSSSNQVVSKFEKGNRSKRINQEEVVLTKATSRQNSVKDTSVATEMDVSFNEYSHADMSLDSGEVSKDQPRVSKGGFVGLIKKGFRDLSKSNPTGENDKSNVSINGKPLSERLLKKAEKIAGTIHPGQYWYDPRAGFWGVMGQPCLGIIPPFIEEFSHPMPENCAGGNTGVYVNGRELHEKDLNLLANRGLPTVTDRSYIIEISGRVLDEDSGEELDNLGKLAPTVEKLKHGFGMRVPRAQQAV